VYIHVHTSSYLVSCIHTCVHTQTVACREILVIELYTYMCTLVYIHIQRIQTQTGAIQIKYLCISIHIRRGPPQQVLHIYIYLFIRTHISLFIRIHTYIHLCIFTYKKAKLARKYIYLFVFTYMFIYTFSHTGRPNSERRRAHGPDVPARIQ